MNTSILKELVGVVGEKFVLTQPGDLYLYSFDSALDRSLPSAVVLPSTAEQVAQVVRVLHRHKIPYVARGAATSLCGGPVPLQGGVVIGLARLNRMGKVDKARQEIFVEPGVVNQRLQQKVAAEGLLYAPDPGSQKACTIGGNVATNAGGPHCLKYGVTSNFVLGVDVVLPDGLLAQFRVEDPGYDLVGFFVGSEGTLGITTRIRLKLVPKPPFVRTMLVSFNSMEEAIQSVTDIIAAGVLPATLEALDKTIVAAVEAFMHAGYPLEAEAVLLIEVDGEQETALDQQVERIKAVCQKNKSFQFQFAQNEMERNKLWEGRRGSYAAMARLAPNVLVEDGAVPRTKLPEALKRIKTIAEESNLRVALLFHAGDGNLHPQIIFDERDAEHTKVVKEAGYKMLKACVDLGGTISGEHGIGIDKRDAMKWLFSRETLLLFRRLKNVFDPDNVCNPDKLIPLIGKAAPSSSDLPPAPIGPPDSMGMTAPASESELIAIIEDFFRQKTLFGIQGSGSKYAVSESRIIKTTKLDKVLDFDRGNLTITVQGGALLESVRALVEKDNQHLWVAGAGTVGGVIATRASVAPPLRDQILGMRVVLPTGELVSLGAKTMKNVAGYDVPKLLIGSWGTLGVILDVTFRLFPYPFPKKMETTGVLPFVFQPIHKKIKQAFDPNDILARRMAALTVNDIKAHPKGDAMAQKTRTTNYEDRFWL